MKHHACQRFSNIAKFLTLGFVWGASFLLIKYALIGLSHPQVGLLRLSIGGLTLSLLALSTGRPWPTQIRQLCALCLVSIFMFVLPVSLYSWSGQFIPSALSATLNATTPIMTIIVTALGLSVERPSQRQFGGVAISAVGIILTFQPWSLEGAAFNQTILLAMLACLGSTLCYAIAYALMSLLLSDEMQRRHRSKPIDAVSGTCVQLICASIICLMVSSFNGFWNRSPQWKPEVIVSILILGALSTGYGYFLNTQLTKDIGPVKTSQVTYVTPVVGVILGRILLGEAISVTQILGGLIILSGIWVTQIRNRER
ncbi:DMT family transporter [Bifidobacterium aquikefiri]|uniref:DMT family transporter n=3 Tax=Bifidobacterium aquikefiri TaxID=1653207 RepID=UPI0039EB2F26